MNYDVTIIGAGPGGYVSAIRAAQLGLNVAIIEKTHLGGICLNWGCIPTKALLRSSEVYHLAKNAKQYGVTTSNVDFNLQDIVKRSRGVSQQLSSGIGHLLKKNKVKVIMGSAKLIDKNTISITKEDNSKENITSKNIVLATGARARILGDFDPKKNKNIWTYKEALVADSFPKKLLVMGSGAIGVEFASFFNSLGSNVTLVELQPQILPVEDEEIAAIAHKSFQKQGMTIFTETQVLSYKEKGNQLEVELKTNSGKVEKLVVDKIIAATGVVPNTENLGLEEVGINIERSRVVVDGYCQTNIPNIYAIGDIVDGPWLAHKASHEGMIVAEKIAGKTPHKMNKSMIPGCTYTHPQIASVGLTEKQAKEQNLDIKIGKFPFIGNGKAIALGEPEGLIKVIFNNKTGELIGVNMIGAEVTELINGYLVGMTLETTAEELINTVFPHPTLSEMMHESVLDAYNRTIHM